MLLPITIIDRLAFGGSGICRIDGKVCFVPFSCPCDEVRLKITSQKKSYNIAEIIELVSPSPARVEPECALFGSCGGCSWQHVSYQLQQEQKRQIFADTLWRGARVAGELIKDVVAAPLFYGYRSRVQFKVSNRHGKLQIGFFRHGSHVVEDAALGCPVAAPQINELLKSFRALLPQFPDLDGVAQISIDTGENGAAVVLYYSGNDTGSARSFLVDHSGDVPTCTALFLQSGRSPRPELLWGTGEIGYTMPGRTDDEKSTFLIYRPGGFAQVNQRQNIALLAIIRRLGNFSSTESLLDLYCGNGNFSIPLAADVASVVGIEGFEDSINSAELNRVANAVSNAEFICLDVSRGLKRLTGEGRTFDAVLLDPPRSGAGDAVSEIASLAPGRIIYVSCDPGTLARDCSVLETHGYSVAESVPVDMFPQTYHLESVTLLVKK